MNILVPIEVRDGAIKKPSLEALGLARRLAEATGGSAIATVLAPGAGAIAETIRAGGEERVIVPALDPTDVAGLLMPTVQVRTAERLGVEVGERDSGQQPLRHCRYIGGNYDDAADFWLDDHDRLARYRFPQAPGQVWEVTLATGE